MRQRNPLIAALRPYEALSSTAIYRHRSTSMSYYFLNSHVRDMLANEAMKANLSSVFMSFLVLIFLFRASQSFVGVTVF